MTRFRILLATVFGAALMASGPASAAEVSCWYNGGLHRCVWYPGYTYEYGYPYGYGLGPIGDIATAPLALGATATEPLMTGRSVAVEKVPLMTGRSAVDETVAVTSVAGAGNYCATPVTTCRLYEAGWLGTGCSCRVAGGHARGFVQ